MEHQAKVSVVIIHQDGSHHLNETLHSVFAQTLDKIEVIVVSSSAIKSELSTPIKLIYSEGSTSVSYTHLTLPTNHDMCRSRWSPYH